MRRWLTSSSDAGCRQSPWGLCRLPPRLRLLFLTALYEALKERLESLLTRHKTPHLKIFRVITALYPEAMTTVASKGMLDKLAQAMGSARRLEPVERHVWVRSRIDALLGDSPREAIALAERMSIPWMLYARFVQSPSEVTEPKEEPSVNLAKIRSLLPEFKSGFLDTPMGREHMAWFPAGRAIGRKNLAQATKKADAGEDVTDFVLAKLLPHLDSPYNRERGAWCCIAPVVTRDIKQWFEGIGWAKPEDWPASSPAGPGVRKDGHDRPEPARAECEAFRESSHSKGFQSGFLSPILNAVRPADFSLVNSKTKRTLKNLAGVICYTGLVGYPTSNGLVRSIVDELGAALPSAGSQDVLAGDVFDAFCHWWVSVYKGEVRIRGRERAEIRRRCSKRCDGRVLP